MTQTCGRMDRQMAKLTMQVWSKLRFKDLLIVCDFSHFEYCFLKNVIKTHSYFITITFKKTIFFPLIYLHELQHIISSGFNEVVWLLFWFSASPPHRSEPTYVKSASSLSVDARWRKPWTESTKQTGYSLSQDLVIQQVILPSCLKS